MSADLPEHPCRLTVFVGDGQDRDPGPEVLVQFIGDL